MNILFLMKTFGIGGQESVTRELAKSFIDRGHKVSIISFARPEVDITEKKLGCGIRFETLNLPFRYSKKATEEIRKILLRDATDIVINQWGLPFMPIVILNKAIKGLKTKIVSVYHHDPQTNTRVKAIELQLESINMPIKKCLLLLKKRIYSFITKRSMRYVYDHSDAYVLLSSSFIKPFVGYIGITDCKKIYAIPNPLTVCDRDYQYFSNDKRHSAIYVGRLENIQKRVDRVIEVWSNIESSFCDWDLKIVGDGPDRAFLESLSSQFKHINFEGFSNPIKYYKNASFLLLTSEYEGFGLVIIEAMSFGVIPVVYGSYSAVYDIIEDGKDGIIIPYEKSGFRADVMAERMAALMKQPDKRNEMALAAIEKSKNYSIDVIYQQWERLFAELLGHDSACLNEK